jgi:hypothetical protein
MSWLLSALTGSPGSSPTDLTSSVSKVNELDGGNTTTATTKTNEMASGPWVNVGEPLVPSTSSSSSSSDTEGPTKTTTDGPLKARHPSPLDNPKIEDRNSLKGVGECWMQHSETRNNAKIQGRHSLQTVGECWMQRSDTLSNLQMLNLHSLQTGLDAMASFVVDANLSDDSTGRDEEDDVASKIKPLSSSCSVYHPSKIDASSTRDVDPWVAPMIIMESHPFPLEEDKESANNVEEEEEEDVTDSAFADWMEKDKTRWRAETHTCVTPNRVPCATRPRIHKIHTVKGLRRWTKTRFVNLFDDTQEIASCVEQCLQLLVDRNLIRQTPEGTSWKVHPFLTLDGSEQKMEWTTRQSKRPPNPLVKAKNTLHVLLLREVLGPEADALPTYSQLIHMASILDGWILE